TGRVSIIVIVNGLVLIIINDIYHDGDTVSIIDTINKSIVDLSTKKNVFLFVALLIGIIYIQNPCYLVQVFRFNI
ncbi:unnamed protein product, partial [Rotaria sp. Silwood1]